MDSPEPTSSDTALPTPQQTLPLVGISSCLLGMRVRYDGQHRLQTGIQAHVSPYVTLLPLCPESMAGMGIPRRPVNLIEVNGQIKAVGRDDPERDVTERLKTMGRIIATTYPHLSGYILQSRSPSCGFHTTPIHNEDQSVVLRTNGHGLFVETLLHAIPDLPILDDTQLTPTTIQEFLDKVTAQALAFANQD
ncbi:MAG: DUF523 domain-containing protein [Ketobacter sp.]|nr:DUF523 domain-containing protein [Ketobacter sp.]